MFTFSDILLVPSCKYTCIYIYISIWHWNENSFQIQVPCLFASKLWPFDGFSWFLPASIHCCRHSSVAILECRYLGRALRFWLSTRAVQVMWQHGCVNTVEMSLSLFHESFSGRSGYFMISGPSVAGPVSQLNLALSSWFLSLETSRRCSKYYPLWTRSKTETSYWMSHIENKRSPIDHYYNLLHLLGSDYTW